MLKGDGNENDPISKKKKKLQVQHTFFSNQQKTKFTRAARIFLVSSPLFCSITMPFCMTKGYVTRDDSQRRFLAPHGVEMLEQCCNHSKQCCNTVLR